MLIGDIFEKDVTRDINPVVYFHEQEPANVAQEVSEYIITGGYPEGDPRANEQGIHEQFVRLLRAIGAELAKGQGPELPAAWISGYYGSGKSSFAKLLGLSFNGLRLPSGQPLAEALIRRDESPKRGVFVLAWEGLMDKVKPMAVVFDIGSVAREDEHIHGAVVRECQKAMGYCSTSSLVADHELKLEADGHYQDFLSKVKAVHGKPWSELRGKQLAEDHFSAALHALSPTHYGDEMAWIDANAGRKTQRSAEDCVKAIEHMLEARYPGRTLFLVVDEVSQYVHDSADRMLALQSFVSALGQRLKGRVWLLATGQQKLEEGAAAATNLSKMKDRFPPQLRVHLSHTNIRDVVHQRLLKKRSTVRAELEELYRAHRPDLALYAYQGDQIAQQDFVDIYPLLPGHIDLMMEITTGLRDRSSRVQGDSHAIRGLLQLLGDLFREQELGRYELGTLITLDRIYESLHTALDADAQTTLARALDYCAKSSDQRLKDAALAQKVLKAVSLLELIQDERVKTDVDLIGRCLYERLGQGSQSDGVQKALDAMKAAGFVDYSEKTGYKIQSSAGQEWQRERDAYGVGPEKTSAEVQNALGWLMPEVAKADLNGLGLPWQAWFSDALNVTDAAVKAERSPTRIEVDFRFVEGNEANKERWVPQSDSEHLRNRIIWVAGDTDAPREAAQEYQRSAKMIERWEASLASLPAERRRLLTEERNRLDQARRDLGQAVQKAFLSGTLYFRGKDVEAREEGNTFAAALKAFGDRAVKKLYPTPVTHRVTDSELVFLIESSDLAAPPPVFGEDKLGLLSLDSGRYEAICSGAVPSELFRIIQSQPGLTGGSLLTLFGGPPYGYTSDIVRASVMGLMRGRKLRVQIPGVGELTSAREEGARNLLKDQTFRKAEFFPNKDESISGRDRNAICRLFKQQFQAEVPRDDDEIANAVPVHFSAAREQLSELQALLVRLPGKPHPGALTRLEAVLEKCRRDRRVEPTLKALKRHLGELTDGVTELRRLKTDVTPEVVDAVVLAAEARDIYVPQLEAEAAAGDLEGSEFESLRGSLLEGLGCPRPWEQVATLREACAALKALYIERRTAVLGAQAKQVQDEVQRLKLREGFDSLRQDGQHRVLSHVREGAPFDTRVDSPAPSLEKLQIQFPQRMTVAFEKALAQLDEEREGLGAKATKIVELGAAGREIDSEQALERLIEEIRRAVLRELAAGHRVRIR